MSEVIKEGDAVCLPTESPVGRVKRLYGKGTKFDPVCAVIEIPAQVRTVRLSRVALLGDGDG